MRLPGLLLIAVLATAQQPPQPVEQGSERPCYQDRSVDEYIAEIHRLQTEAKRKGRFKPTSICVFSFCTQPTTHPNEAPQGEGVPSPAGSSTESSSAIPHYDPVGAAHNTEVGDYYFADKNYRGALMRYLEALEQKRGDAAIHLRLARTYERLKENKAAYLAYDAARQLEREGKKADEARKAMLRLSSLLEKEGVDPKGLVAGNTPLPAPCLAPPATQ